MSCQPSERDTRSYSPQRSNQLNHVDCLSGSNKASANNNRPPGALQVQVQVQVTPINPRVTFRPLASAPRVHSHTTNVLKCRYQHSPRNAFAPELSQAVPILQLCSDRPWLSTDMANEPSEAFNLLELPGPCLQAVVLGLWRDTKDVAALCCCSKVRMQHVSCSSPQLLSCSPQI